MNTRFANYSGAGVGTAGGAGLGGPGAVEVSMSLTPFNHEKPFSMLKLKSEMTLPSFTSMNLQLCVGLVRASMRVYESVSGS